VSTGPNEDEPGAAAPAAALSPWLELMLAEIARKRQDLERGHAEEVQRSSEQDAQRQHVHDTPRAARR
jgi:hypothetical protein